MDATCCRTQMIWIHWSDRFDWTPWSSKAKLCGWISKLGILREGGSFSTIQTVYIELNFHRYPVLYLSVPHALLKATSANVCVDVAFLSWTLWGSPGMCTHTCTCTSTGTLHRARGLRLRSFSITQPCRQPHSVFVGFYLPFQRMRFVMSGSYHGWRQFPHNKT